MRAYHGVYYFDSYDLAHEYATAHEWPTDRILSYGRGWAVQHHKSGPYLGPDNA
jgi:hypothetical protein